MARKRQLTLDEAFESASRELIKELAGALRDLHDIQNGPPLVRWTAEWEEAMDRARKILAKVEPPEWHVTPAAT